MEEGSACDLLARHRRKARATRLEGAIPGVDVVVQPRAGPPQAAARRRHGFDDDRPVECIDELADYAGVRAEVAAVTERAMRGELDFEAALDARVALLEGLDESAIDRCRDERVRLTPGATALVRTMRANGAYCLLVSGGFSLFADRIAAEIGFDAAVSNRLDVADGKLLGTVARPVVGAQGKLLALQRRRRRDGVSLGETLAVGDGANDIPMIEAAGLGIAYRAKPAVAAVADARIEANDLTALLYAQGYARQGLGRGLGRRAAHVGGDRGEGEGDRALAAGKADRDAVVGEAAHLGRRSRRLRDDAARPWCRAAGGRWFRGRRRRPRLRASAAGAGCSAISTHIRRRRQRVAIAAGPLRLSIAPMSVPPVGEAVLGRDGKNKVKARTGKQPPPAREQACCAAARSRSGPAWRRTTAPART